MPTPPSLFPEYLEQADVAGFQFIETIAVIQQVELQVSVDTLPINVVLLDETAEVSQIEIVVQEQPIEVIQTSDITVKEC